MNDERGTPQTLEELFLEFVNAVRLATDLTAVNIAAGVAWQAVLELGAT